MENETRLISESVETLRGISRKVFAAHEDNAVIVASLNQLTKNNKVALWEAYKNAEGPVTSIRKAVAAILKERHISEFELGEIIRQAKEKAPSSFARMYRSWYSILYPFVLADDRKSIDSSVQEVISSIKTALGNPSFIKSVCYDFSGERETGSTRLWIALFNAIHPKQNKAKQLFLSIENGAVNYSLFDWPNRLRFEDTAISIDQPFDAAKLLSLYQKYLTVVKNDDGSVKKILLNPGEQVFKVSMGPTEIDQKAFDALVSKCAVMMHKDTRPLGQTYEKQGDIFTQKMKNGITSIFAAATE
jgi:hypothetical protein